VKRAVAAVLLVFGCLAAAYGYFVTRREESHRQLIQQGDVALARGDTSAAIEFFSGAIAHKSDSMIGYLKLGEAHRRSGELGPAVRDLRRATELDPTAPRPRELLGDVSYAQQRFLPAAERYAEYVALDDRSPRVLYKLALARYRAGQPALGIDALRKAIAIDDRFAEAHYLLALCLRDAQKLSEAQAALQRAIVLAPAMLQAREELADLYGRLGRSDGWIEQLEALRALDPTPARDVTLGLAFAKLGQSDRAIMMLRHAAERHPDHRYAYVALGRVWLQAAQTGSDRADLNKAREALEHAVDVENNSEALMLYGRALLLASDDEQAERILEQATRKLPADPLAFYYLAEAAERRGHPDVARQALLDYAALEGDDTEPRRRAVLSARIADLSMKLNDFPMAVSYYERAAPHHGADDAFVVKLAEARWRAGNPDAARAMLDKLLERDPANAAARALRRRVR
jgi:tetratricopeptide (TPR) repeat protein